MKADKLKLFFWEDVLSDRHPGIAFALAETEEEARQLVLDKYLQRQGYVSNELVIDLAAKPKIIEDKEGFFVWGCD